MKAIIRAAFEKTLADWAAAQTPKIPISFENVPFKPPAAGPYLSCFLLPADTVDNTMAGQLSEYRGLFQVNVVCPAGAGPTVAETLCAAIVALFPAKSRLTFSGQTIAIMTPMRERPALPDAVTYTIPMDCQYMATS